jgi:hypothetical protein
MLWLYVKGRNISFHNLFKSNRRIDKTCICVTNLDKSRHEIGMHINMLHARSCHCVISLHTCRDALGYVHEDPRATRAMCLCLCVMQNNVLIFPRALSTNCMSVTHHNMNQKLNRNTSPRKGWILTKSNTK